MLFGTVISSSAYEGKRTVISSSQGSTFSIKCNCLEQKFPTLIRGIRNMGNNSCRGETPMETMHQLSYLPNELIIQILLRLPVKSLIRFKCVCKYWFSIISNTHFANSQFQLNVATHTRRVLFISNVSPHKTRSVDLEALDDNSTFASHEYPTSLIMTSDLLSPIQIEGSCRGFILLFYRIYSRYYLWNPSTGLHKQIPLSPLCFNLDEQVEKFHGFGYDQSTDDYLIVSMSSDINSSYLEFFSLRDNMWKQIDEGNHIHYLNYIEGFICKPGSLFNGAIHWFAYRPDLQKDVIVCFDLMERKLLDMNLPDEFDHVVSNCGLWVFREFLSLWAMDFDNDTIEIWVMKEYKLHSSWTKTHVLRADAIRNKYFSPLTSTKSGDIVATDGRTGFVKYNDEGHLKYNDEGQLLGHHSYFYDPYGFHVVMYTESLLSLPGDNVQA